ncbi:MAG: hypothetical protein KUG81_03105 [Gammaproteobacteria bacterium]|nr:hypothetical protein [Gammaproteobacteria bacterium]
MTDLNKLNQLYLNNQKKMNRYLLIVLLLASCSIDDDDCDCYQIKLGASSTTSDTAGEWNIVKEFKGDCSDDKKWVRNEHNSIVGRIICK